MLIFDQYYVGMRVDNDKDVPMGYATPVSKDKAFEKRKETVDAWAKGYRGNAASPIMIDNKPTSGFKIHGFKSRTTTDNKVIEIYDPRGFKLQLYISDFIDMLKTSVINKGDLEGEYVWAKTSSGNHFLLNCASEEYETIVNANSLKTESGKVKTTVVYNENSYHFSPNLSEIVYYVGTRFFCAFENFSRYYTNYWAGSQGTIYHPRIVKSKKVEHVYIKYDIKKKNAYITKTVKKIPVAVTNAEIKTDIKDLIFEYKQESLVQKDNYEQVKNPVSVSNSFNIYCHGTTDGIGGYAFRNKDDMDNMVNILKYKVAELNPQFHRFGKNEFEVIEK